MGGCVSSLKSLRGFSWQCTIPLKLTWLSLVWSTSCGTLTTVDFSGLSTPMELLFSSFVFIYILDGGYITGRISMLYLDSRELFFFYYLWEPPLWVTFCHEDR